MKSLSEEEKTALYQEVSPIALAYRRSFITDNDVIKDTFETLEQLGFLLVRFPAIDGDTSLSGFTIHKEPYDCIYINTRQNLGRQYMSCWHECYHAITKEGNGISYIDKITQDPIEYKADIFASIILMPENLVKGYIKKQGINLKYLRHKDIINMQNYFRVGYSAMLTRILHLYPEYKTDLQNRYGIAQPNDKQRGKLLDKTKEAKGDIQLISATNDIYMPQKFGENISFNTKENRISKERAYELLKIIDGLNNDL